MSKNVINELFAEFEKYKQGKQSFDRALEQGSNIIKKYSQETPIAGYMRSGEVAKLLQQIERDCRPSEKNSYTYVVELHRNDKEMIDRMLKAYRE